MLDIGYCELDILILLVVSQKHFSKGAGFSFFLLNFFFLFPGFKNGFLSYGMLYFFLESFNPAQSIDKFHFTGEEGMALVADLNFNFSLC